MAELGCILSVVFIFGAFLFGSGSGSSKKLEQNHSGDHYTFEANHSVFGDQSSTGGVSMKKARSRDSLLTGYDVR